MKSSIRIGALTVGWVLVLGLLHASEAAGQDLTAVLSQLTSNDYAVRRTAFGRLAVIANADPTLDAVANGGRRFIAYLRQTPGAATAVIDLLERESKPDLSRDASPEDPYLGNLIGVIAALRDPRAVNGLVANIETGALATEGLIALGTAAVPAVLHVLGAQDQHFFRRAAAAGVLGAIAGQGVAVDSSAVRVGLVSALSDTSMYVRRNTARSLVRFRGDDIRVKMLHLSTKDPAHRDRAGKRDYPVRTAALGWLAHDDSLKARRPPR